MDVKWLRMREARRAVRPRGSLTQNEHSKRRPYRKLYGSEERTFFSFVARMKLGCLENGPILFSIHSIADPTRNTFTLIDWLLVLMIV